jgi:hypothetical protein
VDRTSLIHFLCCYGTEEPVEFHFGLYGVAWGSRDRWTKRGVLGKGASLDYNEGMTKLACLQRMVL